MKCRKIVSMTGTWLNDRYRCDLTPSCLDAEIIGGKAYDTANGQYGVPLDLLRFTVTTDGVIVSPGGLEFIPDRGEMERVGVNIFA